MDNSIIKDLISRLTSYNDIVPNSIASIAVILSFLSFLRSRKIQKINSELLQQQLEQVKKVKNITPALFLIELDGHLTFLTRILDHINPLWMHRHQKGIFNNKEISYYNLNTDCYNNHIENIHNVDTVILLDHYYKQVVVFNERGEEISNSPIRDDLNVDYYVTGASRLILTAIELYKKFKGMLDPEALDSEQVKVLDSEQVKLSLENFSEQKNYYITVSHASHLDFASLSRIHTKFRHKEVDHKFVKKYPLPDYLSGLFLAADDVSKKI